MITPTLAERAVACKHWRWMPGMRVATAAVPYALPWSPGSPVAAVGPFVATSACNGLPWGQHSRIDGRGGGWGEVKNALPDLTDPATLGCLLTLVREAWGGVTLEFVHLPGGGCVMTVRQASGSYWQHGATSYAEALVAALEAAP